MIAMDTKKDILSTKIEKLCQEYDLDSTTIIGNHIMALIDLLEKKGIITYEEYLEELYSHTKRGIGTEDMKVRNLD